MLLKTKGINEKRKEDSRGICGLVLKGEQTAQEKEEEEDKDKKKDKNKTRLI
jgi:hypothetical protein